MANTLAGTTPINSNELRNKLNKEVNNKTAPLRIRMEGTEQSTLYKLVIVNEPAGPVLSFTAIN